MRWRLFFPVQKPVMNLKILLKDLTGVAINIGLSTTCEVQKNIMSFDLYAKQYVQFVDL